jgi:hypothetical protein
MGRGTDTVDVVIEDGPSLGDVDLDDAPRRILLMGRVFRLRRREVVSRGGAPSLLRLTYSWSSKRRRSAQTGSERDTPIPL